MRNGNAYHPQFESLESRLLLAVDVLENIDREPNSTFFPRSLSPFGEQLIFRGNDGKTGPEAWISAGTAESTQLLKDIRVGVFGSGARDFTPFQNQLYFAANNGFSGLELWVTNGTRATTQPILDIWPGSENGAPSELTVFQDHLYFFANDGETGRELYRTDGTPLGTERIADSVAGRTGSSGEDLLVADTKMFFRSDSSTAAERGIWVSDGTATGTRRVNIPGINAQTNISLMSTFQDKLLFAADGLLWTSDGTEEGSRALSPTGDPLGSSFTTIATDGTHVFVTDELGLHQLDTTLNTAKTISGQANQVVVSGGKAYFSNIAGVFVASPDAAPSLLIGQNPSLRGSVGKIVPVDGGVILHLNRVLDRYEIWASNGTSVGTELLENVTDESEEPLMGFQAIGDTIYFAATNGGFEQSVWAIPAPTITPPQLPGDLNLNGVQNAADIDTIFSAIASGSADLRFDFNNDEAITEDDADFLISGIFNTRRGDLDLNGQVDFADFLTLSSNFGIGSDANWNDGDTDGDGQIGFSDFLALSSNFGFEREP